MGFDFLSQAAKFLQEQKNYKRWLAVFLCLAVTTVFGTAAALKMYGQAMTHQVKVLECQYEVHEHTDDCYEKDENGDPTGDPICGCADYVVHVHNDDCYDENGNLVCPLEEIEPHEHDENCYEETEVLVCEEGESESVSGHQHTDSCYTEVQGELICEESTEGGHTHDDSCYSSELTCDLEEHTHDDGCYSSELACSDESEEHEHDDGCYSEELTCGQDEHTHGDGCYSETLTCGQDESTAHEHTDACYGTKKELTCTQGESESVEGHTHDDSCYETEETLTCEELELHTHVEALVEDGGCYDESAFDGETGEFIEGSCPVCGIPQLEEHVHTEECFKTVELTPEEIAALENGAKLHVHTEACYDEEGNLICTLLEKGHEHDMRCYDSEGVLICGNEEAKDHEHDTNCYDEEGNLTCGYEGVKDHEHDANCYNKDGTISCGYEGVKDHEHKAECYDEEGNLICGYEGVQDHEHDVNCYDEEGNLICGYENAKDHEHDANCYDESGNLICGYSGARNHEHDADCYDIKGNLICGYEGVEDHVHSADCYDEEGNLICGYEVLEVYDNSKIFECDDYIVVARYNEDAHIPEEAELLAEQITEESDEEHYARRESEYQEILEDETASMRALMKIGFYLDDVEVEPETPVAVSIQFLDEDGLAEGSPITVVHFAEEGSERLDGSKAKNSSTTFKMKSFSEVAIGYGPEEKESRTIQLSNSFEYENDEYHITFHIEGEGVLVGEITAAPDEEEGDQVSSETDEVSEDAEIEEGQEEKKEDITSDSENTEKEESVSDTEKTDAEKDDAVSDKSDDAKEENKENADVTSENGSMEDDNNDFLPEDVSDAEAEEEVGTPSEDEELTDEEEGEASEEESEPLNLEFKVEPLSEDTEKYQSFMSFVEESSEENGVLLLQVLSYSLTCDGAKVDLTNCQVTADFTPTEAMVESTQSFINIDTLDLDDEEMPAEEEADGVAHPELVFTALGQTDETQPCEIFDAVVLDETETTQTRHMALAAAGTDNVVGYSLASAANPSFTVQYFARLETIAEQPTGTFFKLKVIDTENKEAQNNQMTGAGGKLPKNTKKGNVSNTAVYEPFERYGSTRYRLKSPSNAGVKEIYLDEKGAVQTTSKLLRIYKDRGFQYIDAPNLIYFNRLAENGNYEIKEIWIGDKPNSINEKDWTIKKIGTGNGEVLLENVHFTNKPATAEKEGFILIKTGTVIKLVCEPTKQDVPNGATFYDYNISDGKTYESNSTTSGTITRAKRYNDTNTPWYIYTDKQGINSNGNNLAFGNNNTKTTLGGETVSGNFLNRINAEMSPTFIYLGFEGCTFSLADSLNQDGTIKYSDNVKAPDMFNESGNPNGKETYKGPGNSLTFHRVGDTYTLTTATVANSSISGLDKFNQPASSSGTDIYATNNFWPMDEVDSAGKAGNDPMFGTKAMTSKVFGFSTDGTEGFPSSDDGEIHNSYFGMHYTVDFKLTEDYIGPLEYLFYGDDDMWVFLSPIDKLGGEFTGTGKLICDIGGVHSSVGEYVNLWDWIKQGDAGAYRLSFFYTERGASGSTCWMQFTLPSVSFSTPEQNTGSLLIEKKVTGAVTEDDEFGFEIKFEKGGKVLQDDYSYAKYKRLGAEPNPDTDTFLERDVLIWNNAKFTVKADEYIVISYLPDGTTYTITEVGPVEVQKDPNGLNGIAHDEEGNPIWIPKPNNPYHPTTSGGSTVTPGVVTGTISKQNRVGIAYTNNLMFALPETGGPGTDVYAAAGALLILLGAGFVYKKKFRERRM